MKTQVSLLLSTYSPNTVWLFIIHLFFLAPLITVTGFLLSLPYPLFYLFLQNFIFFLVSSVIWASSLYLLPCCSCFSALQILDLYYLTLLNFSCQNYFCDCVFPYSLSFLKISTSLFIFTYLSFQTIFFPSPFICFFKFHFIHMNVSKTSLFFLW